MSDPHYPQQPGGQHQGQGYPPQQGQGYPPQGSHQPGYYQEPPKKKHTVRNVLLVLALLFVLFVGGCLALVGGALNEVDEAVTESQENSAPRDVTEGEEFSIGKYTVMDGWELKRDALGDFTADVVVKNTSDETDMVWFTLKALKGDRVLASIDCNTDEIEPGQEQKANCTSIDDWKSGWDRITAESTF